MKYIFIVQGEGRGHLTQAITLSRLLRGRGHTLIKVMVGKSPQRKIPAFFESKIILRRLDAFVILLKNFAIWDEKKNDVFWILKKRLPPGIAKDGTNPEFYVYTQTPLDISSLMNQGVFEEMKTVICTSATLRTGTNFNYWMRRTGVSFVERERVISCDFPSPFPYEKNMLFAVPNDAVMAASIRRGIAI